MNGETKVAPALAASSAWFGREAQRHIGLVAVRGQRLAGLRPSSVSGSLMQILSRSSKARPLPFIIALYSVAVTSAETGPSTIRRISW